MIKNTLFGEVLNGKKDASAFNGCSLEELKQMINSAASRKQRATDKAKYDRVIELEAILKTMAASMKEKPTGVWRTADPETMTLDLINKAVALAQSVKCSYGPTKVKYWKTIDRNDSRYDWAQHNIEVAAVKYPQSLLDEDKWIALRDVRFPDGGAAERAIVAKKEEDDKATAVAKTSSIQAIIADLESRKNISAADKIVLATLKTLV